MAKTISQLTHNGDVIIDGAENSLVKSVKVAEVTIYEELLKLLNSVDVSNGKLQTNSATENFLMTLDKKIYNALNKAGYNASVLQYTRNFNDIAQNTKDLHSVINKISITDSQISPVLRLEVHNTIDKLTGSGMAKDFINPVRENLYRNIMVGADINQVEQSLKDFVVSSEAGGDSKLMRYVKQTSRDAMQQFDGTLQSNIAQALGLNAKRYIGSLIADSRPQCVRWVQERILLLSDLQDEIDWAFNNGSGMNPNCNVATFDIYRGGYNCRHRSIPTNSK